MDEILTFCKALFNRSNLPFGIAQVHLAEDGSPSDVTIMYLNTEMAASAFADPEDLRGKNIYEIWPEGDRSWLHFYYRAAYFNESVEFETVSAEYKTFQHVSIFPIIEGYCGYVVQDITKWIAHINPTMEGVGAGLFFYEPRTDLLLLTKSAKECFGSNTEYVDAKDFTSKLFDPDTAKRIYDVISSSPFSNSVAIAEETMLNGSWVRLSMSPPDDTNRFIIGLVEDISQLKGAEMKSKRHYEIIESLSTEYYALHLIDLAQDTIEPYILRNETARYFAKDVIACNSYTEWLERYCSEYVVEEDAVNVRSQLSKESLIEKRDNGISAFSINCKRNFDEKAQYAELRLLYLSSDGDKMVLAARNINNEVREQIDQKEALENALAVAENANAAKTTFLTNMSHDLRTPLNSIIGFSELALSHISDSDQVRNSLEKIMISGEHLLDLINEILDMSRIESGKIALDEKPLDLIDLIEDVHESFVPQALSGKLELSVDISGIEHRHVLGDALRINQILVNTIGNAIKYTDRGSVKVLVNELDSSKNGTVRFEISVTDTGCGISEDFIDRLFMPFERDLLTTSGKKEGTGLGMAITKSLIDIMGGSISVKSESGKGSEFDIILPLRLDKGRDASKAHEMNLADDMTIFEGKVALVADDDDLSREMMSKILSDRGFTVEVAANGAEALEAMKASEVGHFDTLIMDMRMPVMTGDEAATAIRALDRPDAKNVPIIAVTADAFEEGYQRSREAGMTAHITKPLKTSQLISILRDELTSNDS